MESAPSRYDTVEVRGPRLKVLRKKAKLTQARLAALVGVSRGYIAVIEGESQMPVSSAVALRLAEALKTDVPDLSISEESESPEVPVCTAPNQRRRGFRFGAGYPVVSEGRADMLRDVLRQLEQVTETVRELLRSQEKEE